MLRYKQVHLYKYTCDMQSITQCARQISVFKVLCPTLCLYGCLCLYLFVYYISITCTCIFIYIYMSVTHCWNRCTDMLYNCVIYIFVILNKRKRGGMFKKTKNRYILDRSHYWLGDCPHIVSSKSNTVPFIG